MDVNHYGEGKDYNGPIWFGSKVFQNAGANVMMTAGSGVPYSKQSNITQEAADGINDRSTLEGSLNGSRLPWQFRVNAKINKEFEITVICNLHQVELASKYSDRIVGLLEGEIMFDKTASNVNKTAISEIYK